MTSFIFISVTMLALCTHYIQTLSKRWLHLLAQESELLSSYVLCNGRGLL